MMKSVIRTTILVGTITSLAACGGSNTSGGTPTAPSGSAIKAGLWTGTLPSAPAGSGTISFRVTSDTSLTFVSTKVPTFSNMSGCSSTWTQVVTIGSNRGFSAALTAGTTSLTISGTFDNDSLATGTISGTCSGGLVLLGQTFRAVWAST